ncbi:MAG: SDR family NAD(P)-dependent oxidoreductase, partial [Aquiluna sp.]
MKVNGKVVVVTGAGSGMGRELALELVRRGAKVAAVDMRKETLAETEKLARELGGKVATYVLDITDGNEVAKLPARVEK